MYTEDQAKEKRCYRGGFDCLASECMAWKWSRERETKAFLKLVKHDMLKTTRPNFNKSVQVVYADHEGEFKHTEGYCAIVGKAE